MKRRNFFQSARRKEYRSKRFRNPDVKTKIQLPWRIILGIGVFLVAILSIPFMLGYAPVFAFDKVTVEGLASLPEDAVTSIIYEQTGKRTYKLFPQNNQFYFRDDLVFERLMEEHDFASLEIIVDRKTIHIIAEERIVELLWLSGDDYFFLDLDGKILNELTEEEWLQVNARLNNQPDPEFEEPVRKLLPTMPIINDLQSESISLNQNMVDPEFVENVIELDRGLRRAGILPVVYELFELRSQSLRLKTHNGYDVLVSTVEPVENQINGLNVIQTDYRDRLEELQYIDLRFGSHVFIK